MPLKIFKKLAEKLNPKSGHDNYELTEGQKQAQRFAMIEALGGLDNILNLDACITRLRVTVEDLTKVQDEERFKLIGAFAMVKLGQYDVQVILGARAAELRDEIFEIAEQEGGAVVLSDEDKEKQAGKVVDALGGLDNISKATACLTRVRLVLKDLEKISDDDTFKQHGAISVIRLDDNACHLVYGARAGELCDEILAMAKKKGKK